MTPAGNSDLLLGFFFYTKTIAFKPKIIYTSFMTNTATVVDITTAKIPFDIEIQYHILKMMTKSDAFLVKCSGFLREEYFENYIIGWFFKTICNHYEKYNQPIDLITLKNEILKFPADDRPKYERAFERIEDSEYKDEKYLRGELTGWLRSRKFIRLHKTMENLFNQNERESAYDITDKAIQDIKQIDFVEDNTLKFDHIEDIINAWANSSVGRIPMGIPEMDNALMGGLPKQSLTTVLGVVGSGKTVMLINMAYHAIMSGHKVIYTYHEGSDDQLMRRFISRFTKIPYGNFFNGMNSFTDEEKQKINAAKNILSEYLVIKPWQRFDTTIDDIVGYCRQKKKEWDFDVLIDDYAQLLKTKNANREIRHNQAEVYQGLSMLSAELGICVITPAQGNRAAYNDIAKSKDSDKKLLGLGDIAECFEIVRCSEIVITITRSHEDEINNRAKILLAKQRDGVINVGMECTTDFSRMIMYDKNLGIRSLRLSENQEVVDEDQEVNSNL